MPEPARTIVYRHACDCDTANQPPAEHPEHRFDVDGEPFPWLITHDGATFRRLDPLTSLHVCTVTIMDLHPITKDYVPFKMDAAWPHIDGQPFPWAGIRQARASFDGPVGSCNENFRGTTQAEALAKLEEHAANA